jgi:hypothetical protein
MSNNAPDYEDNLAFEPEMTWEELVEWVKNLSIKMIYTFTTKANMSTSM